jgi:hypothetical protein
MHENLLRLAGGRRWSSALALACGRVVLLLLAAAVLPGLLAGAEVRFQKDILPLLEQRCVMCHNGPNAQQGLQLSSAAGLLKGGAHGAAVVAGRPEDSLLIAKISGGKPAMPPVGEAASSPGAPT